MCKRGDTVPMGKKWIGPHEAHAYHLQVRLGKNGVEEVLGLSPLSDFEKQGLESLIPELKASIEKGIKFANKWNS